MQVHLIGMTTIDWNRYVTQAYNMLGRSPTRSLDNHSMLVGNNESFLASLEEFQVKGRDPIKFLTKNNSAFKHINITFLCSIEKYEEIISLFNHGLAFTINEDDVDEYILIVTGSIYTWREIILTYMRENYTLYLRQFLYMIYSILNIQYKNIFSNYRCVKILNNSYILEEKV